MKRIVTLVLLLIISKLVTADCGSRGIYCLNSTPIINSNGMIIVEFYNRSQLIVPFLYYRCPIYLKSKSSVVPLSIIEVLKGEMNVTQAVLKPRIKLLPNEIYTLLIYNLPKSEANPVFYNRLTKKCE